MYTRALFSIAALTGLAAISGPATAASYTVDCGSGGSTSVVQNQLAALSGASNSLTVTGTCVGDLNITNTNYLSITGLAMTGTLSVYAATHISFEALTLFGTLASTDHATFTVSDSTINGYTQLIRNSSGSFNNSIFTPWTNTTTGAGGAGIACLTGSDCTLNGATISGITSTDPTTPSVGITAGSTARVTVTAGRISGFDWGMLVWNNSTAFVNPNCASVSIDSNKSIGVYVRDGGVAKLAGLPPMDTTTDCPAMVLLSNNGAYGLVAEGGGLGFLYRAQVTGHTTDGVHVQDGSSVKIQSSSIDAATSTGRSARVNSAAHLWFDEEAFGPTAGSTLAGPVCVTSDSSVDTNNSSTKVRTTAHCATP